MSLKPLNLRGFKAHFLFEREGMEKLLPLDEINNLERYLEVADLSTLTPAEVEDEVFDILLIAYANGVEYANDSLDSRSGISYTELQESLNKKYDGKDYKDRIYEYFEDGDIGGILKVADTEAHRMFNDATFNTAKASGKEVYKRWDTMLDDRVRDTHDYLEGVEIPLDERFYTYDDDSALYPGDFGKAENNVNCRCILKLTTK